MSDAGDRFSLRGAGFSLPVNASVRRHRLDLSLMMLALASAVVAGKGVTDRESTMWKLTLALAVLGLIALIASISPTALFPAWLFAAPLLQGAPATRAGYVLFEALYLLPPIVLAAALLVPNRHRNLPPSWIDVLPLAFLGTIAVSLAFGSGGPPKDIHTLRAIYVVQGIGIIAYYACSRLGVDRRFTERVVQTLLLSGIVLSVLAIVEWASGWYPWGGHAQWHLGPVARTAATLENPALLGTFIAFVIVIASAILIWDGPPNLRSLSRGVLFLGIPAMATTVTRGPILALVAVAAPLVMARTRVWWKAIVVGLLAAATLILSWNHLTSTTVFRDRVENSTNLEVRAVIQHVSFDLAKEKPIAGWGYGTFDQAKETVHVDTGNLGSGVVTGTTSHNSFLTILVELGLLGITLFLLPWIVLSVRALRSVRSLTSERATLIALVAAIAVYVISASTFDMRFFSFGSALPWIAAGLIRGALARSTSS
jgi:O-antigen ligase